MKQLIYASRARFDLTPEELVDLLVVSRRANERAGLTGMLLYMSQSFLQVLEGEHEALSTTYMKIVRDERHSDLRLLREQSRSTRMFPDWSMGFQHIDDEQLALDLPGYTPAIRYPLVNPELVSNATGAQTLLTLYARNRSL